MTVTTRGSLLIHILTSMLMIIWSFLITWVIRPMLWASALLSDRIKEQLEARPNCKDLAIMLARKRRAYDDCVVFFCSSAGEYEQAKPLIDRMAKRGSVFCHVFFFSVSGAKFIKARSDDMSWSMAPLDDVWKWGDIFSALRPSETIIVRHEIWPAFLWQASRWSRVVVVNAVVPSLFGRQSKISEALNLAVKGWLLIFVDFLCVVDVLDKEFFVKNLKFPANKISVTGDTKYDRVVERARNKKTTVTELRSLFRQGWSPQGCDILLIGGSVHLPDIELLIGALKSGAVQDELQRIKILLVPHIVTANNIAKIFDKVRQNNFNCELLSDVERSEFEFTGSAPRIIIADEMGRLSDFYGVADFAWIGGAVHDKVHNVLEPAAWGIPVSCGLRFQNSQEAVALKRANLLFSAADSLSLRAYLLENLDGLAKKGADTLVFVQAMAGASDRVLTVISQRVVGAVMQ